MTTNKTDALGAPLLFGQWYGYSSSDGAFVNVVIGRLRSVGEKKATLDVIRRTRYIYGKLDESAWPDETPTTASVQPCHLFPINYK